MFRTSFANSWRVGDVHTACARSHVIRQRIESFNVLGVPQNLKTG
jgi:hypothetical protein